MSPLLFFSPMGLKSYSLGEFRNTGQTYKLFFKKEEKNLEVLTGMDAIKVLPPG
jgi:hypothetical protein